MTDIELKEHILAIILEHDPDLRSPYKLYGCPPMWDLFEKDGLTTSIRPATAQSRVDFQIVEEPGIAWGRHKGGEWLAGEQHSSATFDWFITRVLRPALEEGASLRECAPTLESPTP